MFAICQEAAGDRPKKAADPSAQERISVCKLSVLCGMVRLLQKIVFVIALVLHRLAIVPCP